MLLAVTRRGAVAFIQLRAKLSLSRATQVPRKGGPGITQSDLLVVNKIDLAAAVGADLSVMKRDAEKMRGDGPTVFSAVKSGIGLEDIVSEIVGAWRAATTV